jgi:Xaa-Pro aminopeptidase
MNHMAFELHAARRARLAEILGPRTALVLFSPPERLRNGDVHHKFRQDSDILYLTGFEEPGAVVVLRPGHETASFVMFVRPRNPSEETWTGRRAGVDGARDIFGASVAYSVDELDTRLPDVVSGVEELHYHIGRDAEVDERMVRLLATLRGRERRGPHAPVKIIDARLSVHEMRLFKTPPELAIQRRAADITAEAHIAAMRAAKPGVNEYEIEALIDYTFRRKGGFGPGYPSIVGGGVNATILHYVENKAPLREGDLLLVDAGCEVDGFTADVTRTFPVGGRFSEPQRRVYEAVLDAQLEAIAATKPGATLEAIHAGVVESLTRKMVALGLLTGEVPQLIESGAYKAYYMHRTSHWLGMDVHDVGFYSLEGAARPLEPGMVLTIEPGLYIAPDDEKAPAEYRGIGVRIEDDLVVTPDGNEILTAGTPKSVAEMETLTR